MSIWLEFNNHKGKNIYTIILFQNEQKSLLEHIDVIFKTDKTYFLEQVHDVVIDTSAENIYNISQF